MNMELEQAISLAAQAHAGQKDKCDVRYILHPLAVMMNVSDDAKIAAVLHDVVEDTWVTFDLLVSLGLDAVNLDAVNLLTRRPKGHPNRVTHSEYIQRIETHSKTSVGGKIAKEVKIADIGHNIGRLGSLPKKERDGLQRRYAKALRILRGKETIDLDATTGD